MAGGCPVVAAASGGILDIVTDGENGYLFDPLDPDGVVKATQNLLAAQAERELLRSNARLEAERWGWPAATQQLVDYYEQVVYGKTALAA